MLRLLGFDRLPGRVPNLRLDAASADRSGHRAVLANQEFRALVARDRSVHLNDGRDRTLAASPPQPHDFVVNVHPLKIIACGVRNSSLLKPSPGTFPARNFPPAVT